MHIYPHVKIAEAIQIGRCLRSSYETYCSMTHSIDINDLHTTGYVETPRCDTLRPTWLGSDRLLSATLPTFLCKNHSSLVLKFAQKKSISSDLVRQSVKSFQIAMIVVSAVLWTHVQNFQNLQEITVQKLAGFAILLPQVSLSSDWIFQQIKLPVPCFFLYYFSNQLLYWQT